MFGIQDLTDVRRSFIMLSEWIPLFLKYDVSYIPCESVGSVTFRDLMDAMDGEGSEGMDVLWKNMKEMRRDDAIFRWDACACHDLKHYMSMPPEERKEEMRTRLSVDDTRLYSIYETELVRRRWKPDHLKVILWQRPWVRMMEVGGWPVELRVYASRGKVIAVSNYYVQRDLPEVLDLGIESIKTHDLIDECIRIARRFTPDIKDFSMDFGLMADGNSLTIIEAGPGHFKSFGADPCCFSSETLLNADGSTVLRALSVMEGSPHYGRVMEDRARRGS